ncbi:uncharacterized protein LOC130635974 isoform X1 [Hydractinia symbiolongicarpus]|uniref:uncharacterized protein LOC130635974 isoform X1 n=1 Tax=Hydractinia symbiolongicarpus TaxID=13093 RepID=UPI00254D1FF4|nr:uncharacterized protein LOC130635974 isoform X1 [Hydractinia symbiolongicarpus]
MLRICSIRLIFYRVYIGQQVACFGILFKARDHKSRACIVSHRNDQLFIAAGAKKRAFKWFNALGVTNSYQTALNKNKKLACNYDQDVKGWKNMIESNDPESVGYQVILFSLVIQKRCISNISCIYIVCWQIIGDNLDYEVNVRHQGINNPNRSHHWFHYIAVKDRVHPSQDPKSFEDYRRASVLPDNHTLVMLADNFKHLVTRTIVSFIPAFESFKKHTQKHIAHPFVDEMSKKSEVVSLGLLLESENTASGITKILRHIQKEYVPQTINENGKLEVSKFITKLYVCLAASSDNKLGQINIHSGTEGKNR